MINNRKQVMIPVLTSWARTDANMAIFTCGSTVDSMEKKAPLRTTFLCTLQPATLARPPYTQAATLDTGPLAESYPGGIRARSSSNHFQSACARGGSVFFEQTVRLSHLLTRLHYTGRRRSSNHGSRKLERSRF